MNNTKLKLNKFGVLTAAVAAVISFNASADVNDTIEKTFDFDSDGRIQLSNVNGDVTVTACDCSQVSLTANIKASSQEMRDRISIEVDDSDDRLSVRTKYKNNRGSSWRNQYSEVTYTLYVPNDVNLDGFELVNGNLEINGVTGALDADLVNGELKSDGLTASTKVNMVNGDMDIRFNDLTNAKYIDLESVNGNINVYIPSSSDATIQAETISGRITNDFGIEVIKHKYVGSEMSGYIGSGDVKVDLENVNGKIAINVL